MKYRTLTPKEMAYAQEQLSSRSIEEDTAYWYFPEKMKAKVKRNFPIAFEGCNTAYYPDFVLFNERIIIEIDGGYHKGQKQIDRDEKKDKVFYDNGFAIIRIKNEDTCVNVSFWERLIEGLSKIAPNENRATIPLYIKELELMREREIRLWTSLDYIPEMSLVNTHRHKKIRNLYEYLS
jgi:very-short-patch-repair endonuclease